MMENALTVVERAAIASPLDGYCGCGCGQKAPICQYNDKRFGLRKGFPLYFIPGHQMRGQLNGRWKGGSYTRKDGYVACLNRDHPRASSIGRVLEHILIAEAALGHILPPKAVIHHTDLQHGTIDPHGLVICQNHAYHKLLHRRTAALSACGNANYLKCSICKQYDDPSNLHIIKNFAYHNVCNKLKQRRRAALKREEATQA